MPASLPGYRLVIEAGNPTASRSISCKEALPEPLASSDVLDELLHAPTRAASAVIPVPCSSRRRLSWVPSAPDEPTKMG